MRHICSILIVSLLVLSSVELAARKKSLEKKQAEQAEQTQENEPAIYNDIMDDPALKEEDIIEDWDAGPKNQKALTGEDLATMGGEIKSAIQNHNFMIGHTPYSAQGLPIIYTSKATGFNLGTSMSFADLTYEDPYLYKIGLQLWVSDRGARNHELSLDIPHFFSKNWHVRFDYKYPVVIDNNYFGIGNDSIFNKDLTTPSSKSYISRTYYQFILTYPSFTIDVEYKFFKKLFSVYAGISLEKASIQPHNSDFRSKIYVEQPYGYGGGKTNYLKIGAKYNSTDFQYNPSSGVILSTTYTDHDRSIGSDYEYKNIDITYVGFYSLLRYFTIGQRLMIDQMWGDELPFFALAEFRGYDNYQGLGGQDTLRGAPTFRFIDNLKLIHQLELRTRFYNGQVFGQHLQVSVNPFWDIGRVWDKKTKITFDNFHNSFGSEFRFTWNANYIASFTIGVSRESTSTYLTFGETFD